MAKNLIIEPLLDLIPGTNIPIVTIKRKPTLRTRLYLRYKLIRGWFRLLHHYCPECNSSAPECDICPICLNNRMAFYNWSRLIAGVWWNRFKESIKLQRK